MYMLEEDFNHEKFYKSRKSMKLDDRIMKNKSAEYAAIALYDAMADKIELSKVETKKGSSNFVNDDGEIFCIFTEEMADAEIWMSSRQYKSRKKFLKEAGLIDFKEQEQKAVGNASRIIVKPWKTWVDENGLLNKGKWIIEPSKENFYCPADIVKTQPKIRKHKIGEPAPEDVAEHENLIKKAKHLVVQFHKKGRMDIVIDITAKHFGIDGKLTLATVKELPQLRRSYAELKNEWLKLVEEEIA